EQASKSMQKLSLELGGKSANIVLKDADLNLAVDGALYAFLYHSGQVCTSGTRLFVDQSIYEDFKKALVKRVEEVKVGPPNDPTTGYGTVIKKTQSVSIMAYIEKTKMEGAKLLLGGTCKTGGELDNGYYMNPTRFEATPDNTIFPE